jgi:hypothetical protein
MDRDFGEYRIAPINRQTFDRFDENHEDYRHKLHFPRNRVVASIIYPPHEGATNGILQERLLKVNRMCHPARPKVVMRTGRTNPSRVFLIQSNTTAS